MKQIKSLVVPIVLWYLRTIAHIALAQTRATIIGVAGSVGKTSTREALYAILKDIAPTHMVAGNSETGVPLGLVGLFPKSYTLSEWISLMLLVKLRLGFLKNMRYIIVEMGIDDPYPPKNMEYLLTIVKPDIGIITEESAAHAMQFEKAIPPDATLDEKEKLKAIVSAITHEDAKMVHQDRCTMGIINGDNPFLRTEFTKTKKSILTFGTQTSATIQSTDHKVDLKKTSFSYSLTRDTTKELVTLNFAGFAFPREMSAVFAPAVLAAYHL